MSDYGTSGNKALLLVLYAMPDRNLTEETTADGRSIQVDTGYYKIQVWGDPDDSLSDLHDEVLAMADRAVTDIKEMDEYAGVSPRQYD